MARPWGASTPHECRSLIIFGFALIVLALGALLAPAAGLASTYSDLITNGQQGPGLRSHTGVSATRRVSPWTAVQTSTNNGTYLGTPAARPVPGAIVDDPNGAVLLNSDNDSVQFRPTRRSTSRMVRSRSEAWIKRSQTATNGTSRQSSARASTRTGCSCYNDRVILRQPGTSGVDIATSNIPIVDTTTWHHVVATKIAAGARIYIDGADRTSLPPTNAVMSTTTLSSRSASAVPSRFAARWTRSRSTGTI